MIYISKFLEWLEWSHGKNGTEPCLTFSWKSLHVLTINETGVSALLVL